MTTKQEKICAFLSGKGFKEVKSKSSGYRTFERPNGEFYFVGKNGSLRTGKTVSDSFSVSYKVAGIIEKME